MDFLWDAANRGTLTSQLRWSAQLCTNLSGHETIGSVR